MTPNQRLGLVLQPLDTLFFRDGRPFGASNRVEAGMPTPQTVAGALRTALLTAQQDFEFAKFHQTRRNEKSFATQSDVKDLLVNVCNAEPWRVKTKFRGPWLALISESADSIEPLLPVPLTLARFENSNGARGTWLRSAPRQELPGWKPKSPGLLPLWRAAKNKREAEAEHPGGFMTLTGVERFLQHEEDDREVDYDSEWLRGDELYDFDTRTGIEVDANSFTSKKGQIYGIRMLSLKPSVSGEPYNGWRVGFYVELMPGNGAPESMSEVAADLSGPIPLGGEGRYVEIMPKEKTVSWPTHQPQLDRSIWLLATPGIFGGKSGLDCWRPNVFSGNSEQAQLKAAASASPLAVSGWDVARNGPKPMRHAVSAGSVYYVEGKLDMTSQSMCESHRSNDAEELENIAQGWGFALQGAWKNE